MRSLFRQLPRQRAGDHRPRASATKARCPDCFIFVGGHSASFIARDILDHAEGAIDCVLQGRGRGRASPLLEAARDGAAVGTVPGAVTATGEGPPPRFVDSLDDARARRATCCAIAASISSASLDPCASIEFSRGCPWDCTFCSAWTFYGRSYRIVEPGARRRGAGARSASRASSSSMTSPSSRSEHGIAIGEAIARARHQEAILSRDARRRAAAQQGGVPAAGGGSASNTCSSAWRRSTRRG